MRFITALIAKAIAGLIVALGILAGAVLQTFDKDDWLAVCAWARIPANHCQIVLEPASWSNVPEGDQTE